MAHWFHDQEKLRRYESLPGREDWITYKAGQSFHEIAKHLPAELRDPGRVGYFDVAEIEGADGLQPFMVPIEGHRKILMPKSQVKIFCAEGKILFKGSWEELEYSLLEKQVESFLFLAPKEGVGRYPLSLRMRLQGIWRYLKYKVKSG